MEQVPPPRRANDSEGTLRCAEGISYGIAGGVLGGTFGALAAIALEESGSARSYTESVTGAPETGRYQWQAPAGSADPAVLVLGSVAAGTVMGVWGARALWRRLYRE